MTFDTELALEELRKQAYIVCITSRLVQDVSVPLREAIKELECRYEQVMKCKENENK